MISLFVSRQLEDDSPIIGYCDEQSIRLHGESLLSFTKVPFDTLPKGEWLFFYSKSGVKFFVSQCDDLQKLATYKIACYGPSTAKRWMELTDREADFIGNGKPKDVPADFRAVIAKKETVVFVRAKHSKMSVQKVIERDIACLDIIAYENNRRDDIQLQDNYDVVMLTSPMNADAFLEACPDFTGKIITLGTTTSDHLSKKYQLASVPATEITESGMLKKLQELAN